MHVIEGKERQLAMLSNEAAQNWALYKAEQARTAALEARVTELTNQRDAAPAPDGTAKAAPE